MGSGGINNGCEYLARWALVGALCSAHRQVRRIGSPALGQLGQLSVGCRWLFGQYRLPPAFHLDLPPVPTVILLLLHGGLTLAWECFDFGSEKLLSQPLLLFSVSGLLSPPLSRLQRFDQVCRYHQPAQIVPNAHEVIYLIDITVIGLSLYFESWPRAGRQQHRLAIPIVLNRFHRLRTFLFLMLFLWI